jgi:hypothetical protein
MSSSRAISLTTDASSAGDRPVGRLDREAAAQQLEPLVHRRDLAELACHDVVLGRALDARLELRHPDDEHGLRLVEPPYSTANAPSARSPRR